MPLYVYRCNNCEYTFEAHQRMSDNPLQHCPSCQQDELRRVINHVGVVFKGSGFYVTDSRKSGSNGSSSSSTTKSRESKSENKTDTSTTAAE